MNKMAEGEIPKKFGIFHKLYEDCRLTKLSTMEKQEYEKSVLEYFLTSQKKPRAKHSWLFYWLISGKLRLLDGKQYVAFHDSVALFNADAFHHASFGRVDVVFHLHGFQQNQVLASGHDVAFANEQVEDCAREG